MLIHFGCHFLLKSTKLSKMVKISIDTKYSTNHCFSKSLKYGGNTKKGGFTIYNINVIKNKHTQFSFFSVRVFADFTSMKNFLWHLWTCSEYVKVFSEGGEHNAFESVTYDTKKKNGALQYEQLWLFWNQVRNVHL